MRRISIWALLGVLLAAASRAEARGNNYRGPNGAVPPAGREPLDPTPPPPPPPAAAPIAPPPRAAGPSIRRFDPPAVRDFSAWPFWYHHQRDLLEPRPEAARTFARTDERIAEHVLPTLMRATNAKTHGDAVLAGTACTALGRAARSDEHIARLLEVLHAEERPLDQRSGAALGLGLLARTDPKDRFPAATLDRVRDRLYGIAKDDKLQGRLRAIAIASIGLLGDQPTASSAMAAATLVRLGKLLAGGFRYADLGVALLHAMSLQPEAAWNEEQRTVLRRIAVGKHKIQLRPLSLTSPHAILALGRVGTTDDVATLGTFFTHIDSRGANNRRAAAVALGTLARRLRSEARRPIAAILVAAMPRERDPTAHKLLTLALARTAAAELETGGSYEGLPHDVTGVLRSTLRPNDEGELVLPRDAAYAMLGLGLMARSTALDTTWRADTARLLRAVLADDLQAEKDRAAAALALGMLRRGTDRSVLQDVLADTDQGAFVRAAAARGLLHAAPLPGSAEVLLRAMFTERAAWVVRVAAADVLGKARSLDAQAVLATEVTAARGVAAKGAAALALANLGQAEALSALLAVFRADRAARVDRHVACAALGHAASPEPRSALGHLVADSNWRVHGGILDWLATTL